MIQPLEIPDDSFTRNLPWLWLILLAIVLQSCHDKGEVAGPTVTLEMMPVRWACDCADWITTSEFSLYDDDADSLAAHCVFLEPASDELILPESYEQTGHVVRFTGRFYERPGFPKGFSSVEDTDEAKVFQYTSYELVKVQ